LQFFAHRQNEQNFVRTQKHALTHKESAIHKHLRYHDQVKHIQGLYNLPDLFINENYPLAIALTSKEFLTQIVAW